MNAVLSVKQWLNQGQMDGEAILLEQHGVCHRREFMMNVAELTSHLRSRPELCVILVCKDTGLFIRSLLALVFSGKTIYLPANSQRGTLKELRPLTDALMTDEVVKDFEGTQILANRKYFAEITTDIEIDSSDIQQSSLIFYTSGSCGQPKPVVKHIKQLEKEINGLQTLWGSALSKAVTLACVTHQHIYGVLFRILWPLLSGRLIDTTQYEYPEQLITQIHLHQSVAMIASPAQLSRLPIDLDWLSIQNSNVTVFSSGASLSPSGAEKTYQCFGSLPIEVLGSTETGAVAWRQQSSILIDIETTLTTTDHLDHLSTQSFTTLPFYSNYKYTENIKPSPTGWQPLPGVQIIIEDEWLKVFSPWLDNPELGFLMADRAYLTEDGFLLLGRSDRIVKIEGKRVSLSEMERRLCCSDLVSEAWLVELTRPRKQIGMIAALSDSGRLVLKKHGRLFVSRKLREDLSNFFEAVTLPKKWRFLDIIPVNQQGKRVNSDLLQLFAARQETDECDA